MSNEVATSDLESAQSSEEPEVSTNDLPEPGEETEETQDAPSEDESEDESDDETEDESEDESEDTGDDAAEGHRKKKRNRVPAKKRISQLTTEREELKQELEREREERRQLLERLAPPQQHKQQEEVKRPRRYDFDSDEAYDAALDKYLDARDQRLVKTVQEQFQQTQQMSAAEREQRKILDQAKQAEKEFASEHDDYFDSVKTLSHVNADAVRNALPAESVPRVLYHLAQYPEKAEKIASFDTTEQAVYELGRIDAALSQKPRRKETTQAPEKPRKVGGRGKAVKGWHPGMSMSEVMKKQGYRK